MTRRTRLLVLLRLTLAFAIVFNGLWSSWSMASMALEPPATTSAAGANSHDGCHAKAHSTHAATTSSKHGACGRDCCKGSVCNCGCTAPVAVVALELALLAQIRPLGPQNAVAGEPLSVEQLPSLRPPIA